MTISQAIQFALLQRRQQPPAYRPEFCRRLMRGWARCWKICRQDKERFDLAELALGNALAWRDRATWPDLNLRDGVGCLAVTRRGRVMSTPELEAGGASKATTPPAFVL